MSQSKATIYQNDTYLVTWIFRMNGNGSITQHSLNTGSSYNDSILGIFNFISKFIQNTKLELLIVSVSGDTQKGTSSKFLAIDFKVG
jgi:hypothetical protein